MACLEAAEPLGQGRQPVALQRQLRQRGERADAVRQRLQRVAVQLQLAQAAYAAARVSGCLASVLTLNPKPSQWTHADRWLNKPQCSRAAAESACRAVVPEHAGSCLQLARLPQPRISAHPRR